MKKILFLSLLLMGSIISRAYDFSAVAPTGQTLYYNIISASERTVQLTYSGDAAYPWWSSTEPVGNLTIPETVTHNDTSYTVTSLIRGLFDQCAELTSVTIPNTITVIPDYAFGMCTGLTSVVFPSSLASIGDYAFHFCHSLTSVSLPSTVSSLGIHVFMGCENLASVSLGSSLTAIGEEDFYGCASLTDITFPSTLTSIGKEAFYGCGFTSLILPDGLVTVGSEAFYGCASLTRVTIPNSVTTVGGRAFQTCRALTHVVLGSSVTSIGDYAFSDCAAIDTIVSLAVNPPSLPSSNVFRFIPFTMNVLVPQSSYEAYRNANIWRDYHIVGIEEEGGDDPTEDISPVQSSIPVRVVDGAILVEGADRLPVAVYDAAGRLVARHTIHAGTAVLSLPRAGLYLVRVGSLPAQKVIVAR
ncbi:MAG: leucine-rich repeat domain-containing protein [Bacteroidales bacterium]|nr:leucine-rich repeat domain-containing protein [Bacteroidales bacterium]